MKDRIQQIGRAAISEIDRAEDLETLESMRVKYLARKGGIAILFDELKSVPAGERPAVGKLMNEVRSLVQSRFDDRKILLEARIAPKDRSIDLTLPGRESWIGSKHPITQTLEEIERIF